MMTKKNYEAFADIIRLNIQISDHQVEREAVYGVAQHMAAYLKRDNPNFDIGKFLTACTRDAKVTS